jgi:hypothetical protein
VSKKESLDFNTNDCDSARSLSEASSYNLNDDPADLASRIKDLGYKSDESASVAVSLNPYASETRELPLDEVAEIIANKYLVDAMMAFHKFLFRSEELTIDVNNLTDDQLEIIASCLVSPSLKLYTSNLNAIEPGLEDKIAVFSKNTFNSEA